MDRNLINALVDLVEEPTEVSMTIIENRSNYLGELDSLLKGRHLLRPTAKPDDSLRFIYFADRAALSIAMMVFDGDEFFEPKFLCRLSEHQSWKSFGGWPWEPRFPRRRRRIVPPTQA